MKSAVTWAAPAPSMTPNTKNALEIMINLRVMSAKIRLFSESAFDSLALVTINSGLVLSALVTSEAIWKDECNYTAKASI